MKQNNFNAVRCAHYPLLGTLLWQFGLIWPHSDNKTVGRSKLTIFLLGGALKHVWCLLYIFNIFHGLVLTSLLDINFTRVSMSLSCCSAQERYTILWALRWARVVCCGWSEHWKSWSWFQLVKDIGKQGMAYHGFLASKLSMLTGRDRTQSWSCFWARSRQIGEMHIWPECSATLTPSLEYLIYWTF